MCFFGFHKWGELKDDKQTCLKCGKTVYVNPCKKGHSYGAITDRGFMQCKKCGDVKTVNLCKIRHRWVLHKTHDIVTSFGATQTVSNYQCSNCGRVYSFNETIGKVLYDGE